MRELIRSNDAVLLSFVESLLRSASLDYHFLDLHTSVLEGSIGAIPRRIVVPEDAYPAAVRLLEEADVLKPGEPRDPWERGA